MKPYTQAIIYILFAVSCTSYDPTKYGLAPETIDSVLTLTASTLSAPADGISTVVITAQINPNAVKREVEFTATDGVFTVGAQRETTKAVVFADSSGVATTELRTSSTVGRVAIDAAIKTAADSVVRRALNLQFTPPAASSLALRAGASSLPADGFSRVQIVATLNVPGGNATQRQIEFKTSEGKLYAAGNSADVRQAITPTADGTATVELESTKNVRDVRITATAAGVTREVIVRQVAVDPSSIITISAEATTAPADGASTILITAHVASGLPPGRRDVTFSAIPSTPLSQTKVTADGSNKVNVLLQSPTTLGPVHITGTVDEVSTSTAVNFVPAQPDRIVLSTSKTTVQANATDSIVVTAQLQRNVGTVTEGTSVLFSATSSTGTVFGSFAHSPVTNAQGVATVTFYPGASAPIGEATITGRTTNSRVVGTTRINVIP